MARDESATIRILCVDDEPGLAELIAQFLEREESRFDVTWKQEVDEALDFWSTASVDAIVSDYDMPELNGLDFLEEVRAVEPNIPFILYTGKGSEEIASRAISRGVTEYMQKQTGSEQYSVLANRIRNAVERHRAERRSEQERVKFQTVFEKASDAMIIADDDGVYQNVNSAACDLFDRPESDLLGKTAADFTYDGFDFETAWDSFQEIEHERGLFPVERPDGSVRVAEYAAKSNILPGMHLSVLRDITEQREYERQMHIERERLSEFAGVLSHDLKNHVQVAKGNLELLANGLDRSERDRRLETAKNAVTRIEHVIGDVLAISRTGEKQSEERAVNVSEMAEGIWNRVSTGAAQAAIEPDIVVTGDEWRLQRLLMNLFRNTVEHGGERVAIRVGRLGDRDGFFVEDDGPGIPSTERDAVFDWLHSTKEGGTGIGLKSVKQIIDAEGWSISIEEGTMGGARFEISV